MIKNIDFWKCCIENGQLEVFEQLFNFIYENKFCMYREIRKNIFQHLTGLTLS